MPEELLPFEDTPYLAMVGRIVDHDGPQVRIHRGLRIYDYPPVLRPMLDYLSTPHRIEYVRAHIGALGEDPSEVIEQLLDCGALVELGHGFERDLETLTRFRVIYQGEFRGSLGTGPDPMMLVGYGDGTSVGVFRETIALLGADKETRSVLDGLDEAVARYGIDAESAKASLVVDLPALLVARAAVLDEVVDEVVVVEQAGRSSDPTEAEFAAAAARDAFNELLRRHPDPSDLPELVKGRDLATGVYEWKEGEHASAACADAYRTRFRMASTELAFSGVEAAFDKLLDDHVAEQSSAQGRR